MAKKGAQNEPRIASKIQQSFPFWLWIDGTPDATAQQLREQKRFPWSIGPGREKETPEGSVFSLLDNEADLEIPLELRLPKKSL